MRKIINVAGLIDVLAETLVPDAYVLVDGEKILAAGRRSDSPAPEPATQQVDFSGQYMLPGLINCHAHLCKPSQGVPFFQTQSKAEAVQLAFRNLALEQANGITTVRDCGDLGGVLLDIRPSTKEKALPRMVLCGPPLTTSQGHAHFLGGVAEGRGGLRDAAEKWIGKGADFIKLIATGGGTPGTLPAHASYPAADMAAAVKIAHSYGKIVSAHCRGIPGIENAIKAGIDHIEHACFELPDSTLCFDQAIADEMAEAGITVTPTIQLYRDAQSFLEKKQDKEGLTEEECALLAKLPQTIDEKYKALKGFLKAGVPCVAGNDAGLPHTGFGCLWQELEAMILGGMDAMQAICAATITAARALGLSDRIGSIGVGKQADLFVVDGDPLADISVLKSVRMVMQAGQVVFDRSNSV